MARPPNPSSIAAVILAPRSVARERALRERLGRIRFHELVTATDRDDGYQQTHSDFLFFLPDGFTVVPSWLPALVDWMRRPQWDILWPRIVAGTAWAEPDEDGPVILRRSGGTRTQHAHNLWIERWD